MNHKRKRPKHQRAGCLLCKPHKDERVKQSDTKSAAETLAEAKCEHGDDAKAAELRKRLEEAKP